MSGPAIFGDALIGGPAGSVGGGGGAATQWPTSTVTTDSLLTVSQGVVRIDASAIAPGATLTITIPQAALVKVTGEQQYLLKRVDTNAACTVLIQRDGTNMFEGIGAPVTSLTMAPGDALWFSGSSDTNTWLVS
jgi:hypothetical protein